MKTIDIENIKPGDTVWWTDPDNERCSRHYEIKSIKLKGDIVIIEDVNGAVLECEAGELEIRN